MRGKISIDLSFCQAENGYSLDELVQKLENCFEQKAYSELLRMILQMTQEILLYRILYGKSDAVKCCSYGYLSLNGRFERRIRTSLDEFKMNFWRVRCSKCGKTFAPLARFIGLERYQTKRHYFSLQFHSSSFAALNIPNIPIRRTEPAEKEKTQKKFGRLTFT